MINNEHSDLQYRVFMMIECLTSGLPAMWQWKGRIRNIDIINCQWM
jgi:hypothetical protein